MHTNGFKYTIGSTEYTHIIRIQSIRTIYKYCVFLGTIELISHLRNLNLCSIDILKIIFATICTYFTVMCKIVRKFRARRTYRISKMHHILCPLLLWHKRKFCIENWNRNSTKIKVLLICELLFPSAVYSFCNFYSQI